MVNEIMSPNVTKIVPNTGIRFSPYVRNCEVYDGNIFVIDTGGADADQERAIALSNTFAEYEKSGHLYPVSVTGLKDVDNGIGSYRFCNWDPKFARDIDAILNSLSILEGYRDKLGNFFKREQTSKYFRFMKYQKGGEHFPHYDSDFEISEDVYTKYTLVAYFTNCESGAICFVNDDRGIEDDWDRQASESEIYLKILPKEGRLVLFPHTLCHTVLPYTDDGSRIIARGDVIFRQTEFSKTLEDYRSV